MRLFIIILLSVLSTHIYCQIESDSIMYWDRDTKLDWTCFKGKVLDSSGYQAAVSYIQIDTHAFWEDGMPNYMIFAIFKKCDSWSKDTSKYGLIHEQKHFDIGELFARKMRKAIADLREEKINNSSKYLDTLNILFSRYIKFQELYDIETAHGVYQKEQIKWNKKIKDELKQREIRVFERRLKVF